MIHQTLSSYAKIKHRKTEFKNLATFTSSVLVKSSMRRCHLQDKTPCGNRGAVLQYHRPLMHCQAVHCITNKDPQESSDEDDPVECVREIKTDEELLTVLEKAKKANTLVVVDFYRTPCVSCKYIEQSFAKMCKGSGDEEAAVIFLKHNVIDEYDEQSDIAERL